MLLLLKSIKGFVCWVLRSHGNRQTHFQYEFSMYWWFIEWCSTSKTRYRFASKPGTLAKLTSTKSRVQFVDLPKVWSVLFSTSGTYERCRGSWGHCELHKKDLPRISKLLFNFLLHLASRHHDSGWPRRPLLSRIRVERDSNLLRGGFCIVVQAS